MGTLTQFVILWAILHSLISAGVAGFSLVWSEAVLLSYCCSPHIFQFLIPVNRTLSRRRASETTATLCLLASIHFLFIEVDLTHYVVSSSI